MSELSSWVKGSPKMWNGAVFKAPFKRQTCKNDLSHDLANTCVPGILRQVRPEPEFLPLCPKCRCSKSCHLNTGKRMEATSDRRLWFMCMGRKREMLKSKNRSVCFLRKGGGPGTQESLSAQWLHPQTSGGKTVNAGHFLVEVNTTKSHGQGPREQYCDYVCFGNRHKP